jgi:hypothetical protein
MATLDTLVKPILQVKTDAPPPGPSIDSVLRTLVTIQDDERPIILESTHPRYRLYRRILQGFQADKLAPFLDVDPATRTLRGLAVGTTGAISALDKEASGEFLVQLVGSSRIFILKPGAPDFAIMRKTLQDAVKEPAVVSIRTKDFFSDEIEDVKRVKPFVGTLKTTGLLFGKALIKTLTPVDEGVGRKLFDFLAKDICNPAAIVNPCMPFEYPEDGCTGRSHMMCNKLFTASLERPDLPDVLSGKIWCHGAPDTAYEVETPNSPECKVRWLFHCAPLIRITDGTLRVLDPSLFDEPVLPEKWELRQTDKGKRTISDRAVYYRRRPTSAIFLDPGGDNTRNSVGAARWLFDTRVELKGPPPYC